MMIYSGGGIAGLSLAVTLGKYSQLFIDIYESAQEVGAVGAGLVVWKRTWEIMLQLGLDVEMTKRGIPHPCEAESVVPSLSTWFAQCAMLRHLSLFYCRSGSYHSSR